MSCLIHWFAPQNSNEGVPCITYIIYIILYNTPQSSSDPIFTFRVLNEFHGFSSSTPNLNHCTAIFFSPTKTGQHECSVSRSSTFPSDPK
mmetsp:Transcript_21672/g.44167  ORF Transcript_21672/g.44167 Transcript_21672/m.44167 type:complete len:90 (-) Transcript_21672:1581-1850(-)